MRHPFTRNLLDWYDPARRPLPWKETSDPYHIWLSEIILQQTRVEQGMPYYRRFVSAFPTVADLAAAPQDKVLKLWEGLGYYSRARNLLTAARQVTDAFGGTFPDTYASIRSLKGVGDYTAAAIASFAYGLPYAVLDGNVFRVLARYFGADIPMDTTAGKKYFAKLAQELLPENDAALFNQAIMDFGALVCTPRQPACSTCPLNASCIAFLAGTPEIFPVRSKKMQRSERYFNYIVKLLPGGRTEIRQRQKGDIWTGLFEFPMVESTGPVYEEGIHALIAAQEGGEIGSISRHSSMKQDLTHRRIWATFWLTEGIDEQCPGTIVRLDDLRFYAFPGVIRTFLEDFLILGN
jgi:A/G-specific adenine glycosylase